MQPSIQRQEPLPPNKPNTASRLRTVTGSRWPRKCACGCGLQIPRDPEVRYVVDFGGPRPDVGARVEAAPSVPFPELVEARLVSANASDARNPPRIPHGTGSWMLAARRSESSKGREDMEVPISPAHRDASEPHGPERPFVPL